MKSFPFLGVRTSFFSFAIYSYLLVKDRYETDYLYLPMNRNSARTIDNTVSGDIALSREELSAIDSVMTVHGAKGRS